MRLLLIDYGGTLTRLKDPVGFINALKAQGDYVVMHTGNDIAMMRKFKDSDDMMRACNRVISKGAGSIELLVSRVPEGITEAVIVDDESLWESTAETFDVVKAHGWSWRYVYAGNIESLLTPKEIPTT